MLVNDEIVGIHGFVEVTTKRRPSIFEHYPKLALWSNEVLNILSEQIMIALQHVPKVSFSQPRLQHSISSLNSQPFEN